MCGTDTERAQERSSQFNQVGEGKEMSGKDLSRYVEQSVEEAVQAQGPVWAKPWDTTHIEPSFSFSSALSLLISF